MLLLQVTSFFWIVYLDSIFLPEGVIAYFFDEYWSSWTAWLGCMLVASLIYLEKAVLDAMKLLNNCKLKSPSGGKKKEINNCNNALMGSNTIHGLSGMGRINRIKNMRNKVQHRNSIDDVHRDTEVIESIPPVPHSMSKSGSKDSMINRNSNCSSNKQNNKDDKQINIEMAANH